MTLVSLKSEREWLYHHKRRLKHRLWIVTRQIVLQKAIVSWKIFSFYNRDCIKEKRQEIIDLKKSLNTIDLELICLNQLIDRLYEGWVCRNDLERQIYVERYFYHWNRLKIYMTHRHTANKKIKKLLQSVK